MDLRLLGFSWSACPQCSHHTCKQECSMKMAMQKWISDFQMNPFNRLSESAMFYYSTHGDSPTMLLAISSLTNRRLTFITRWTSMPWWRASGRILKMYFLNSQLYAEPIFFYALPTYRQYKWHLITGWLLFITADADLLLDSVVV